MTPNELLLWLSARRQGSWTQFRSAVETLELESTSDEDDKDTSLPLHQRVRLNLERLGHLEFDAMECEDGWRVVPPTLSLSQHDGGVTGVMCGARTSKLMADIEREMSGFLLRREIFPDCPDVIRVEAPDSVPLEDIARRVGIHCQLDAPTALLSHLPSVAQTDNWPHEALPKFGKDWDVKQFVIEGKSIKWRKVSLEAANLSTANGLFCFTRFQTPQYFLREGRDTIKLPGSIGKYWILSRRRRRVLRYDRRTLRLSLPAIVRPPLLTERALILCSGLPPSLSVVYKRRLLTYHNIPEEVAGMTAELLRQDLS